MAAGHAHSATDAQVRIDYVRFADVSHDSGSRAVLGAYTATAALLRIDGVGQQSLALLRAALVLLHVLLIFFVEVVHRGEDRVRRSLSESAESGVLDDLGEVLEHLQVLHLTLSFGNLGKDFEHPLVADAAWSALSAGFTDDEFKVELRDGDHAVVFVHHDHTSGTHHRTSSGQAFVVDRNIQVLFRKAAAGRSARLDGLEFLPVLDTSTDVVDDFTQRGSHRNFDKSYVVDFAGKGEHLGTLGLLGTDGSEPFRSLGQDDRDVGKGLDVVDVRRFTEVTGLCRERWLQGRLSALSFHGMDEGCLFSADECSGTVADLYVEVESGSEDVLAQETIFPGLLQGDLEPVDGERILSPDIDKAVVRADAETADGHGFEDGVRVA